MPGAALRRELCSPLSMVLKLRSLDLEKAQPREPASLPRSPANHKQKRSASCGWGWQRRAGSSFRKGLPPPFSSVALYPPGCSQLWRQREGLDFPDPTEMPLLPSTSCGGTCPRRVLSEVPRRGSLLSLTCLCWCSLVTWNIPASFCE